MYNWNWNKKCYYPYRLYAKFTKIFSNVLLNTREYCRSILGLLGCVVQCHVLVVYFKASLSALITFRCIFFMM